MVFPAACFEAQRIQMNRSGTPWAVHPPAHGVFAHKQRFSPGIQDSDARGTELYVLRGTHRTVPCASSQFQSAAGGEILRLASLAQDDREEVSFHTPSSLGHGVRIATPALRRWFAMTELRSVRSAARISFVSVGAIHESPADADACLTNGLSRAPAPTARNDVSPFHAPRIPIRAAQRHTTILHRSLFTLHFPRPLCA